MAILDDMISTYLGQGLDTDKFPPKQPYQCYDPFIEYIRRLSGNPNSYFLATLTGFAQDIYNAYDTSPLLQSLFDKLPWDAQGQRGDVAVWGVADATPYSHVALLEQDNGTSQHIFGQNQPFPYCTERDLTSRGLLGYLRPKTNQSQGDTNVAIIEYADNWKFRANKSFQMIRGREMSEEEFKPWVGHDFLSLVEALEDNPEADAENNFANIGKQATSENWRGQVTDLTTKVTTDEQTIADLNATITALKTQLATSPPVVTTDLTPVVATPVVTSPTSTVSPVTGFQATPSIDFQGTFSLLWDFLRGFIKTK